MVFHRDTLKHNYKLTPFSYRGFAIVNHHDFVPSNDEYEERCYNNIDIKKLC